MYENIHLTVYEGVIQPLPWSHEEPLVRYHFGAYETFPDSLNGDDELGYLDTVVPLPGVADIEYLEVENTHRKHGIGTLLLRATLAHFKQQGFTHVQTESFSPNGIRTFNAALPPDVIDYISYHDPELGVLPVRFDQTLASAERAQTQRESRLHHEIYPGFGASISLSRVDTSDWPLPKLME